MNFSALLALFSAVVVFVGAGYTSTDNPMIFINPHAALIVLGGTFSAAAISIGTGRVFILFKVFAVRLMHSQSYNYATLVKEILKISEAYRTDSPKTKNLIDSTKDHFLKETMTTIMEGALVGDQLQRVLVTRARTVYRRYHDEAIKIKNLAKFPPAFGLMGAVFGMIGILSKMGGTGADSVIGPALAIALVSTLYGIALSNLFILPISEHFLDNAKEIYIKNTIIVEGALIILKKENPIITAEELNSFLLASERLDWKTISPGHERAAA